MIIQLLKFYDVVIVGREEILYVFHTILRRAIVVGSAEHHFRQGLLSEEGRRLHTIFPEFHIDDTPPRFQKSSLPYLRAMHLHLIPRPNWTGKLYLQQVESTVRIVQ